MSTLLEFYDYDIPDYIRSATKKSITINTSEGAKKVTIEDVVRYYATDARDMTSGFRQLGSIGGDWRPIDRLANEVLQYFKFVNRRAVEREAKQYGMTLTGA